MTMTKEEFIKKAKELGLSIDEIDQFIKNQETAEHYGFADEYSSVNVVIDKEMNPDEEDEKKSDGKKECCCHGEHCHCEHDGDECECGCHKKSGCECGEECHCCHHNKES